MTRTCTPEPGQRRIRILSPETRRWRMYDVDETLDVAVLQRLNDLAFLYGVELISTCAGHARRYGIAALDPEYWFANVRFGVFSPVSRKLEGQQGRICTEMIARAVAGEATITSTSHGHPVHMWHGPDGTFSRSFLIVRHSRATHEDPAEAHLWWSMIADRLERGVDASVLPGKDPTRRRRDACEIDDCVLALEEESAVYAA